MLQLVRGAPVLDAARIGTAQIAAELGGLSPGKLHAAEVAAAAGTSPKPTEPAPVE